MSKKKVSNTFLESFIKNIILQSKNNKFFSSENYIFSKFNFPSQKFYYDEKSDFFYSKDKRMNF